MKIEIKTGGAAFHADNPDDEMLDRYVMSSELKRLFDGIYCDIRYHNKKNGTLIDTNGNRVGEWSI